MGLLVEGKWQDRWYDTESTDGAFVRKEASFRNWLTHDGSAGPSGTGGFAAEAGRYHLFVSLACPWAHRTLIFRAIKGLQELIGVTLVAPLMLENGWEFAAESAAGNPVKGLDYLYQLYLLAGPHYSAPTTGTVQWAVSWPNRRPVAGRFQRLVAVNSPPAELFSDPD